MPAEIDSTVLPQEPAYFPIADVPNFNPSFNCDPRVVTQYTASQKWIEPGHLETSVTQGNSPLNPPLLHSSNIYYAQSQTIQIDTSPCDSNSTCISSFKESVYSDQTPTSTQASSFQSPTSPTGVAHDRSAQLLNGTDLDMSPLSPANDLVDNENGAGPYYAFHENLNFRAEEHAFDTRKAPVNVCQSLPNMAVSTLHAYVTFLNNILPNTY